MYRVVKYCPRPVVAILDAPSCVAGYFTRTQCRLFGGERLGWLLSVFLTPGWFGGF